jgi:tetratricopeptide (TPR) repeat protein
LKDLETIVMKCLRKEAGDRYGTAEAMGQDLRRFVRGEVVEARPEGKWERMARRIAHHRRAVLTGLLVLVAAASAAALLIVLRQRDLAERAERYRAVVEEAILTIEIAYAGPVEWEDAPPRERSASDVDEWFGEHQRALLEQAVGTLTRVSEELPRRPEAHYHKARALRLLRRNKEAERELRSALNRDRERLLPDLLENDGVEPSDGDSWSGRWIRLRSEKLPIADRLRGYSDLARELRLRGEPYAGLDLELRIEQGRTALRAREYQRAVEIFSGLCQERPEAYKTALLLARAYYLLDQGDQAKRVAQEALRVSGQPAEAGVAFAALHAHFGAHDSCRDAIQAIPTRPLQIQMQLLLQTSSLSREEILRLDAELAASPSKTPTMIARRAWVSLYELGEPRRGVIIAEEGLEAFPRADSLHEALGWCLSYACEFQKAIAAFERGIAVEPTCSSLHNGVGFAQYRLGNLELSEAALSETLRIYARLPYPYYGRGKVRWLRGDLPGAVDDLVEGLLLDLTNTRAAFCLAQILGNGEEELFRPHWSELRKSLAHALSRRIKYPVLLGLLALSELHGPAPDARAALVHAEEGLAASTGMRPWLLDCLAQTQEACGDRRSAVRSLELAAEWADVHPVLAHRLSLYRKPPAGSLLTCQSIDEVVKEAFAANASERSRLLAEASSILRLRSDAPRLRYLESRAALEEGDAERSLGLLQQAMNLEGLGDDAALIHHAQLLTLAGQRDEALRILVLQRSASPSLWAVWLRIAAAEPALPWSVLLERELLTGLPSDTSAVSLASDVRWVLEQLASTGTLRINCDGAEYTDTLGQSWGADRFFCGGEERGSFVCEPDNAPDPTIYRTRRWMHSRFGYRIPVPPGRYELVLHFFEDWGKPGGQRFDVILNGSPLLEAYAARSPERPNDAKVERFEINAQEGLVALLFVPKEGYVSVAGIELRWLSR